MYLHGIMANTVKSLRKDDEDSGRKECAQHYTFEDIIKTLELVNAGRQVSSRGKRELLFNSFLLNPYSSMHTKDLQSSFDSSGDYVRKLGGGQVRHMKKAMSSLVREFVEREFQGFADVMDGITKENLYRVIYEHKQKKMKVREQRQLTQGVYLKKENTFSPKHGRLYPLSKEAYGDFALRHYRKVKAPMFRKQFINGVRHGEAKMEYYQFKPRSKGLPRGVVCVDKRFFGIVQVQRGSMWKIGIDTDIGVYTRIQKNNGKRQDLWELTVPARVRHPFRSMNHALRIIFFGHRNGRKMTSKDIGHIPIFIFGADENLRIVGVSDDA